MFSSLFSFFYYFFSRSVPRKNFFGVRLTEIHNIFFFFSAGFDAGEAELTVQLQRPFANDF